MTIAIISIILTMYITIQIKHTSSKNEAINILKSIVGSLISYCMMIYLTYHFSLEVLSDDELTRKTVFIMIMDAIAFFFIFLTKSMLLPILEVQKKQFQIIDKHLNITKDILEETSNKTLRL